MTSPLIHPDDGRPQAMAHRCDTCILRPGGSAVVAPAVVRDLIGRHRRVGAVVTCHKTLPEIHPEHAGIGSAACRGFLDAYPDTLAARLAVEWFGGWHLIDPPSCSTDLP